MPNLPRMMNCWTSPYYWSDDVVAWSEAILGEKNANCVESAVIVWPKLSWLGLRKTVQDPEFGVGGWWVVSDFRSRSTRLTMDSGFG